MSRLAKSNSLRIGPFSFDDVTRLTFEPMPKDQAKFHLAGLLCYAKDTLSLSTYLIGIADYAYLTRRMDLVDKLIETLNLIPLPYCHRGAGDYYHALSLKRKGVVDKAAKLFDEVAGSAHRFFATRAIWSIAPILFEKGQFTASTSLYLHSASMANKAGNDLMPMVESHRASAILKSLHGDHRKAVTDLEELSPYMNSLRRMQPLLYYPYVNSLAVELCEVGRFDEAFKLSNLALASPYASAYPEWHETRADIIARGQRASHSIIYVGRPVEVEQAVADSAESGNLYRPNFSAKNQVPNTAPEDSKAVVRSFEGWKMANDQLNKEMEPDPIDDDDMDVGDQVAEVVRLLYKSSPHRVREVLALLRKPEPKDAQKR